MGEAEVVQRVLAVLSGRWRCSSLGPGDDAACPGPGWERLLFKIDGGSVEQNMAPWMTWRDLGWLIAAGTVSDIAAKAGRPLALMVSLGVPPGGVDAALEIVEGVAEAAEAHGAWLAGGDTNASPTGRGWVDVAAVGVAVPPWGPLARRPRVGDEVYTTVGRYGLTGAAFHSLEKGEWRKLLGTELEALLREATRPAARLGFAELAAALPRGCLTGSVDVSDGLAASLRLLAEAADAAVELERLPSPHPLAVSYARRRGVDLESLVLYGGQEYEILFTIRPSCTGLLEEEARGRGLGVERLGVVAPGPRGVVAYRGSRLWTGGWDNLAAASGARRGA